MDHNPQQHEEAGRPAMGVGRMIKGVFVMIGRVIATFFMVGVITGCIVACVTAVYILQLLSADNHIDLEAVRMGYTSLILAQDANGEEVVLARLHFGGEDRTWVDFEEISPWVMYAAVAVEDRRFWEHGGVDWRRTVGAFVGMFGTIQGTTTGGGSTITQQVVKNVTGDSEARVDRKVQEIFRALDLSTRYSREDILEAYLNLIPLGNGTNGIQAAANFYFGIDAVDLSIAQSAALVGITQFPGRYNPYVNPEDHRLRQLHILWEMHDQGMITTAQYNQAISEELILRDHEAETGAIIQSSSYFVDRVIEEVIADFQRYFGMTRQEANRELMSGGFRIHTTVDLEMQAYLEDFFLTTERFPPVNIRGGEYPQSATVILDPEGRILATVGGIGEKIGHRTFNRATMSRRHPGSALKPIGPFALGIDRGFFTWSTIIEDSPLTNTVDGWSPVNWYSGFMGPITIDLALRRSVNTVAAKMVQELGPDQVFHFLRNDLQFTGLVDHEVRGDRVYTDIALSPMSLGALTHGVSPLEMAAAYNIFNNGGYYIRPFSYTRIENAAGDIIHENRSDPIPVISRETSVVMNRLLQHTVTGSMGTGSDARLPGGMPVAGKTGTSQDDVNQWFVGMTPYYVAPAWLGFDRTTRVVVDANGRRFVVPNSVGYQGLRYPPPILWRSFMAPLHEDKEVISFPDSPNVQSMTYCLASGGLATAFCPATGSGWYTSRLPSQCIIHRFGFVEAQEDTFDSSSGDNDGSDGTPFSFGMTPEQWQAAGGMGTDIGSPGLFG
ncbi:MAG: transglycosylase domain-containing protein [Oscillospiraceae bacterium]|nr:transglycosylase domain-containing protein [Oscillospiraceae bacterium]